MAKLVINFIGAPNTRKSTTAFGVFSQLKKHRVNCEMSTEVAKEYVFERNQNALDFQLIVWAQQAYRLWNAANHAEVIVSDAPILMGLVYILDASTAMCAVVLEEHHKYTNINILMPFSDTNEYNMVGRVHDLQQSEIIHRQILDLLNIHQIPYLKFEEYTESELVSIILEALETI